MSRRDTPSVAECPIEVGPGFIDRAFALADEVVATQHERDDLLMVANLLARALEGMRYGFAGFVDDDRQPSYPQFRVYVDRAEEALALFADLKGGAG